MSQRKCKRCGGLFIGEGDYCRACKQYMSTTGMTLPVVERRKREVDVSKFKDRIRFDIPETFPLKEEISRFGYYPPDRSHVSMVILNWNGIDITRRCLHSIYRKTSYPYEVLIIDNVSGEYDIKGLKELVSEDLPITLRVFLQEERTSFDEACNFGIRMSTGRYVLLLNNDTIVVSDHWLDKTVTFLSDHPDVGIVGYKLLFPNGRIQHIGGSDIDKGVYHPYYGRRPSEIRDIVDTPREVDWVTGAAFMIRREVIDEIGGLDQDTFHNGYEDPDYCLRARLAGWKTYYIPVTLIHLERWTEKRMGITKTHPRRFYDKWRDYLPKGWGGFHD